jgi:hypothetical protein
MGTHSVVATQLINNFPSPEDEVNYQHGAFTSTYWRQVWSLLYDILTETQINYEFRSRSQTFQLADRNAVIAYYKRHPIIRHTPVNPDGTLGLLVPVASGQPACSGKSTEELRESWFDDLQCPMHHAGKSLSCEPADV